MADVKLLARIELENPVTAHDETISVLELRDPTGGDILDIAMMIPEGIDEAGNGVSMKIPTVDFAAKLAGVPPSSIRALSARDAMKIAAKVNPFLLEYLGTYTES